MVNDEKDTSDSGGHPRPLRGHEDSAGKAAEPVPASETVPVVASASVGHGLHWPQNHELAQISIPDLLVVVSHNALAVIPAERCVVFMYEKSTNLLSAHVSSADGALGDHEEELSFPPVMGVVSACFLQRRCLRMQEPNLHKAFHRDYDVPKDVTMDSMIVAPVTLHHRTVGVIQLLNRIDPDCSGGTEPSHTEDTHPKITEQGEPRALTGDEEIEMKLLRTKAVQQRARIGFSAKDEQKMILFTSHVAQLLDNKLRLLAQVESIAKAREEKAKSAIELLNMMNEKLEYQATAVPVPPPLRPKPPRYVPIFQPPNDPQETEPPQDSEFVPVEEDAEPEAPQEDPIIAALFADADILKVMKGISRTQALFRGHHLRKVHRLSEALTQHRERRRQIRSTLVLQRATRRFLARRWRKRRRNAVMVIVRAIRSHRLRARIQQRIDTKKRQKRRRSMVVEIVPQQPQTAMGRNGGVGLHHTLLQSDVVNFRQRFASAVKIQQFFRGYRARKQVKQVVGFTNASKGVRNVVKLQSFVRGTIARTKVKKILQEKRAMRAANVVCMRLAASQDTAIVETRPQALTTRDCVYPLVPVQPNGAPHVVANRHITTKPHVDEAFDELRQQQLSLVTISPGSPAVRFQRRRRLVTPQSPRKLDTEADTWLESRPLAASPATVSAKRDGMALSDRLNPLGETQLNKSELSRLYPTVVFEVDAKKAKRCPAGVQHADDWLRQRRRHSSRQDPPRDSDRDERSAWHEASSNFFRKQAFGVATSLPPVSSNQASALPLLLPRQAPSPRSQKSLQVCLLPAGSHRHTAFKRLSESALSPSAQPQERTPLPPTGRRALTTRWERRG